MPHAASYVIIISVAEKADLILYHMITSFDAFEISCIGKNYGIIFSKVLKTLRKFFLIFFSMLSKNRNYSYH